MAISELETVKVSALNLDPENPRAAGQVFANTEEAIAFLRPVADLNEIVTSILTNGWIEFEPLIVLRQGNIVLEGNRRLASIMLINDTKLRAKIEYKLPVVSNPQPAPDEVQVRFVDSREEARSFIAFKHINGPAKWAALAKAKYAADWVDQGVDIYEVAQMIGDNHSTIVRMINGWRVLQQAQASGFSLKDITAKRFNFSHLYTAISKPVFREHLGLKDDELVGTSVLTKNPIPASHKKELTEAMLWMYGSVPEKRQHVVKSQNPDLTQLVQVLPNPRAMAQLVETKDLKIAFEVIMPASKRFEEQLYKTVQQAERANGVASAFDPEEQSELMEQVNLLAETVKAMRGTMRAKAINAQEDDL